MARKRKLTYNFHQYSYNSLWKLVTSQSRTTTEFVILKTRSTSKPRVGYLFIIDNRIYFTPEDDLEDSNTMMITESQLSQYYFRKARPQDLLKLSLENL